MDWRNRLRKYSLDGGDGSLSTAPAFLAFLLLVTAVVVTVVLVLRTAEAEQWVLHSTKVRQSAQVLTKGLLDAENAQRGYLLSGKDAFLQPYTDAVPRISNTLARLKTLTKDNEDQQRRLETLAPLIQTRMDVIRDSVALMRDGKTEEARAVVTSIPGKSLMNDIVEQIAGFSDVETRIFSNRLDQARTLRQWLLAVLGTSFVAAVASGLLFVRSLAHFVMELRSRTVELRDEEKRRRQTEETLRHAQKMEAVGQLSGGIAHDFNNLLTIILGNLDTVQRRLQNMVPGHDAQHLAATLARPLDFAMQGARSAALLTHRLLAFSRRQALEPARVDVNRLVSNIEDMLRRTLGETVQIETVLAGGLWATFADNNQLENALLNLAVNARDAMPDGGRVTIETANSYLDDSYAGQFGDIIPGQYVMLSVSDTGTGIPPEIITRVFEPFFTTKAVDKGSGLGLAMIHGFVKQSEGHVRIYSEVDQGTTVKIYLPRLMAGEAVAAEPGLGEDGSGPVLPSARPFETILLVEDNDGVREYATFVLEELGYKVEQASNAEAAFALFRKMPRIDMLFTDVVLPAGVSGRVLADRVLAKMPSLPVLFTTGYTRNAIVHHGRLDAGVNLLNKPYTQQELARKIREVLDKSATGVSANVQASGATEI